MKKVLFLLMAVLFAITGWTQNVPITIGTGTTTSNMSAMPGYYGYNLSAQLYSASEINLSQGGTITSMEYHISSASTGTGKRVKIYLLEQTGDSINLNQTWATLKSQATLVYDSTSFSLTSSTWKRFTFTSPFTYNGGSILVLVEGYGCSTTGGCATVIYCNNGTTANCWNRYKDSTPIDTISSNLSSVTIGSGNTTYRANVKLNITPNGSYCYIPDSLDRSNITTSGFDLSWTQQGNPGSWEIAYKTNEDSIWSSQIVSTNPYTLSLTSGSMYNVKVRAICGDGDTSSYSSVSNFGMPCDVASIPYTQNFDGTWWNGGDTISNASRPWCWTNIDGGSTSYNWKLSTVSYAGAKAAYYYGSSSASTAVSDWLITPKLNLTSNQRIKFYAKKSSSTKSPNILIYALNCSTTDMISKADTANFVFVDSIAAADLTTTYKVFDKSISSLNGTYRIAFVQKLAGQSSVFIDELQVTDIPSCPDVYYPVATIGTTGQSAKVSFDTTNSNGSGWVIAYGELANGDTVFNPETATSSVTVSNASELPYEITGLNPSTKYYFAVQQNCGGNWSDIVSVTTMPISVTVPYTQDFETETTDFVFVSNSVNKWYIGTATDTTNGSLGGHSLYISDSNGITNHYNTDVATYAYSLMSVDFGNYPEYQLSFAYKLNGEINSTGTIMYDYLRVYALPTSEGIPTTTGFPTNGTLLGSFATNNNTWQDTSITLIGAEYTDSIKSIVFCWRNDGSTGIQPPVAIDNISIIGSTCSSPDSLYLTNLSSNEATITCHNTNTNNPDHYVVSYSVSGANSWTEETTPTIPYTIQNLTENTDYVVKISAFCSSNSGSIYSAEYNFHTPCIPYTTLPYTENFDSVATNGFPNCWIRTVDYSGYPKVIVPVASHTYNGKALEFRASMPTPVYAVLNSINADIHTLKVSFMAQAEGANSGSLEVGVMSNPNDTNTFELVKTITRNTSYTQNEVRFNNTTLTGNNAYIAFRYNNRNGNSSWYYFLDSVSVDIIPDCASPDNLSSVSTSSSLQLSFTPAHSTDNSWRLYYKEASATDFDSIDITTNPYTIDNLQANTEYNVKMATNCAAGLSEQSLVQTFRTSCPDNITVPFTENFDIYGTGNTAYPQCWSRINSYTTYSSNYPYINYTHYSGVGSLYFYASSTTSNIAITPMIDTTVNINTLTASFMYNSSSLETKLIVGVMTDPTDSTTFTAVDTIQATAINTWELEVINLASYTGTGHYIALWNSGRFSFSSASCYVDSLSVIETPTCARPTNVNISNVTTSSVDVSWINGHSTDNSWRVYYKVATDSVWDSVDATTNPYTLSNLNSSTIYKLYVVTNCGNTLSEISVPTVTFATECTPIVTLPYSENFDLYNNEAFPICWSRIAYISSSASYPNITTSNAHNGKCLTFHAGSDTVPSYAITPQIGVDIHNVHVTFYGKPENISYSGALEVGVMSNPNDISTFELVQSIPSTISNYSIYDISFNNTTLQGDTLYVAFRYRPLASHTNYYWFIDDVVIDNIPTCLRPSNINVSNITTTTADIAWVNGDSTNSNWRIYYKPTSSTMWDSVDVTTNPYTLTNLTAATSYDVNVATDCGDGNVSLSYIQASFATHQIPATLPYTCDFEDATENASWLIKNGSCTNKWYIGTPTGYTSNKLFVSNDGTAANYDASSSSIVVAERAFTIGASDSIKVEFDLTIGGESTFDYLKVFFTGEDTNYLASTSTTVPYYAAKDYASNVIMSTASISSNHFVNLQTGTVHMSTTIPNIYANTVRKLILLWKNDGSGGTEPGAVIDSISVTEVSNSPVLTEPTVTTTAASGIAQTTATLNGTVAAGTNPVTAQGFEWKATNGGTYTTLAGTLSGTTLSATLSGLTANTSYTYRAFATTSTGNTYGSEMTFTTIADTTIVVVPPTVTTLAASGVAATSAILNGTVTAGTHAITAQGFQWKATNGGTYATVNGTLSGTALNAMITNLTAATGYTYRAFATTADTTVYGVEKTFTTLNSIADVNGNEFSVKLYPNPTEGDATLSVEGLNEEATVIMTDVQGRVISSEKIAAGQKTFTIRRNNISSGVYYIRVITNEATRTEKLIVK